MTTKFSVLIDDKKKYKGSFVREYIGKSISDTETCKNKISEICFGNEFCEKLIPNIKDIEWLDSICKENEIKAILVTPPVSDNGIKEVTSLLDYILRYQIKSINGIIVNDVGILQMIKTHYPALPILLGRIFDKTDHDGRIGESTLKRYYGRGSQFAGSPSIVSEVACDIWKKYGVESIGIDLPNLKIVDSDKWNSIKYDVYLPYTYVTTGRLCLFRAIHKSQTEKFIITNEDCSKECMVGTVLLNSKRSDTENLIRKGNTIFSQAHLSLNRSILRKAYRVIYQIL